MSTAPERPRTDEGPLTSQLGLDRLADEAQELSQAMAERGISTISDGIDSLTDRLIAVGASGGETVRRTTKGGSAPKAKLKTGAAAVKGRAAAAAHGTTGEVKQGAAAVKDKVGGLFKESKDGSQDKKLKVTNIVEEIDVPVDRSTAYELWTRFEEFPSFMKKVENVRQKTDATVEWTAQVLWSHRSWTAKIVDQVPGERIVWRSKGDKGHVDGAVTFHELAPNLTRILLTLEYHPQGLIEHTGNLWRAQGRRVRLELKHFRRHVGAHALLDQERPKSRTTKKSTSARSGSARKSSARKSTTGQKRSAPKSSSARKSSTARKSTGSSGTSSARKSSTSSSRKTTAKKRAPAKKR